MNLIEQLKQTHKWNEFEKWFDETYTKNYMLRTCSLFQFPGTYLEFEYWCDFPFEMQSDVFVKYLSDLGCYVTKNYVNCTLSLNQTDMPYFFNTSEELILWYFNN